MVDGKTDYDTCIIVMEVLIEDESIVIGTLFDAVCEVLDICFEQIEPSPRTGAKLNPQFIQGLGQHAGYHANHQDLSQ